MDRIAQNAHAGTSATVRLALLLLTVAGGCCTGKPSAHSHLFPPNPYRSRHFAAHYDRDCVRISMFHGFRATCWRPWPEEWPGCTEQVVMEVVTEGEIVDRSDTDLPGAASSSSVPPSPEQPAPTPAGADDVPEPAEKPIDGEEAGGRTPATWQEADQPRRMPAEESPFADDDEIGPMADDATPLDDDETDPMAEEATPSGDDEADPMTDDAAPRGDDDESIPMVNEEAPATNEDDASKDDLSPNDDGDLQPTDKDAGSPNILDDVLSKNETSASPLSFGNVLQRTETTLQFRSSRRVHTARPEGGVRVPLQIRMVSSRRGRATAASGEGRDADSASERRDESAPADEWQRLPVLKALSIF